MYTAPTLLPRRALRKGLALLVPGALLLFLIAQAFSAAPSRAARAQAAMQAVTIHAATPQFPKTLTTGLVALTFVNDAKQEFNAGFGRINPGVSKAEVQHTDAATATSKDPLANIAQLFKEVTGLGGVDDILPGASQTAIVNFSTPGNYAVSVSPQDGADHLLFFTVTAGSGTATLPAGDVSVTLKNFKFTGLPQHLAAGTATFTVTNSGNMVHEMQLTRLTSGKTQKDVEAFIRSPQAQNGPFPSWIVDDGGMGVIAPKQSAAVRITLTPGYYVVLCFMPDMNKQGEPHVMEGMIGHFTVS